MRVAFAGTPEFALPALHALAQSPHQLVGVLTQPDRPRGRGQRVGSSPVKAAAERLGAPIAQPATLRTDAGLAELASWQPDVLVVVAYGLILPAAALALPRSGCVNIHASLLPRWRGAAPIQRAILAGDGESGVTIMLMDAGLDTGPMLLQKRIPLRADETAGTLHDTLAALGAEALIETLARWPAGDLSPRPQPPEGATYAAKIDKSEAMIDWRTDAAAIERQVRAFNPSPVAETRLDGEQLRIFGARARPGGLSTADAPPGLVLAAESGGIVVGCGRGRLLVTQVQRPGRRPVPARELASSLPLVGRTLGTGSRAG
ncbi:MAG TPA: methionyl-tRNA formyltransferase [Steroidobacteraceae bacterium]|nr:methionyl-tRNA formyltransferase [Steroidobacteraceae bacterium]